MTKIKWLRQMLKIVLTAGIAMRFILFYDKTTLPKVLKLCARA